MKRKITQQTAVIANQGQRPAMEDFYVLIPNLGGKNWLFGGIYDGHAGKEAAEYAAKHLHIAFLERLLAGVSPQVAFTQSYENVSDLLNYQDSGTTAVTFLIKEHIINIANAGDARAIVVGHRHLRQLTEDHRLGNNLEKERILRSGGQVVSPYVYRNDIGLMPTRTIGDPFFKPVGVIATPYVNEYPIGEEDSMLIAASDGLFDFMSNEEIAGMARKYPNPRELLPVLEKEVLVTRMGTDNLTIIAVSFR